VAFPVYSTRLLSGHDLGAFSHSIVVPAGFVWVIRDIDVYYGADTGPSEWECDLIDQDAIVVGILNAQINPSSAGASQWRGRQCIEAGCTMRVETVGGTWYWTISGYQLTLP